MKFSKIGLLCCFLCVFLNANSNLVIKYWKVPKITYEKFYTEQLDKSIYTRWSNENAQIRIYSNVQEDFGVGSFSTFLKNVCIDNHRNDVSRITKTCIALDPFIREHDLKIFTAPIQANDFSTLPVMFGFDYKVGIIIFDLSDKFYGDSAVPAALKRELKLIPEVIKGFREVSGMSNKQIIILGSFGVGNSYLNKMLEGSNFKAHQIKPSKINKLNNEQSSLSESINIIYSDDFSSFKKMKIRDDLLKYTGKQSIKESFLYFHDKVSSYFPLDVTIESPFNGK